jgi:predicted Zn-dependent protease
MTPSEIAAVRPLRIGLVVARPGDTVESMAARMTGLDRATERFQVLNGLDRGGAL